MLQPHGYSKNVLPFSNTLCKILLLGWMAGAVLSGICWESIMSFLLPVWIPRRCDFCFVLFFFRVYSSIVSPSLFLCMVTDGSGMCSFYGWIPQKRSFLMVPILWLYVLLPVISVLLIWSYLTLAHCCAMYVRNEIMESRFGGVSFTTLSCFGCLYTSCLLAFYRCMSLEKFEAWLARSVSNLV